jgi:hypothetical protein
MCLLHQTKDTSASARIGLVFTAIGLLCLFLAGYSRAFFHARLAEGSADFATGCVYGVSIGLLLVGIVLNLRTMRRRSAPRV